MRFIKSKLSKKQIIGFSLVGLVAILFIGKYIFLDNKNSFFEQNKKAEFMEEDVIEGYRTSKRLKKGEAITVDKLEAVLCKKEEQPLSLEELLEKKARMNVEKGLLLTDSNVCEKQGLTDDMRIHNFPYIRLTDHMKKGDYIDVRISFSNGCDFVLLSKKKIEDIAFMDSEGTKGNALWLQVTEEELLRLSSAVVDAYLNEGCQIYAIQYMDKSQKEAVINYSVRPFVRQLMDDDPNILERAKSVMEWSLWEDSKNNEEIEK